MPTNNNVSVLIAAMILSLCRCVASPVVADTPMVDATKRIVTVPIADTPSYTKRALVIGVDSYENVQPLTDCSADAHAFADLLRTKFGFQTVTLMTDEASTPEPLTPTYLHIKRQLEVLSDGIVAGQTQIVLFYSGHGVRHQNAAGADADYIVPLDGDPDDIEGTCVDYTAFKNDLATRQPSRALLVMDACRNLLDGKSLIGSEFGAVRTIMGPQIAELLSCQPTQVSREGLAKDFSESVFTHYLIQGLSGDKNAVDPDKNVVTFDSLMLFVQGEVSDYVARNFSATQIPDGEATFGEMVLARYSPDVKPTQSRSKQGRQRLTQQQRAVANACFKALWAGQSGNFFDSPDQARIMTIDAVRQSLNEGADPNSKSADGRSALMAAVTWSQNDIVRELLHAGADKNARDIGGNTALMFAAHRGNYDGVKLLLRAGARKDQKNNSGATALMQAAGGGHAEVVKLLVDRGANINEKRNFDGDTALMIASSLGHSNVVKLLLDAGADKRAVDNQGRTALYYVDHRDIGYLGADKFQAISRKQRILGFDNANWTLNSLAYSDLITFRPVITGDTLQLTRDGTFNTCNSAFFNAPLDITAFTAGFIYRFAHDPAAPGRHGIDIPADGITFTLQNDARGSQALSRETGGTVAYPGIAPSAAIPISIYSDANGTTFWSDGILNFPYKPVAPVDLLDCDPINVVIDYSNGVVTETLTDQITGDKFRAYYRKNLQSILKGNTAYVGFTGATGNGTSSQYIRDFYFSNSTSQSYTTGK